MEGDNPADYLLDVIMQCEKTDSQEIQETAGT